MKYIAVLGSTGSIGCNTLRVVRHLGEQVAVVALAAKENIDLLEEQAREFRPDLIAVYDEKKVQQLQKRLPHQRVLGGMEGLEAVATHTQSTMVISAISGTAGLRPTLAAIKAGKNVGIANKESLVSGGALVMKLVREKGIQLIPIDSEHSAIFQCLTGEKKVAIRRIILTASGGPFRAWNEEQLEQITVEQALRHPTWNMGPKVTIDSSTLMNKGLEVIEAHWLFEIHPDQIHVILHPQSIIHGMIECIDGSLLAQMGEPTMIAPIQYALTYPNRCPGLLKEFDFLSHSSLQFSLPDKRKFRCLELAYQALRQGGSFPCYMNAANEVLVHRFLIGEIKWKQIGQLLDSLLSKHQVEAVDSLDTIFAIDALARQEAAHVT